MEPALTSRSSETNPGQRILTGLATIAILIVIYGSWLPFKFQLADLSSIVSALLAPLNWSPTTFGDAVTNIVVYIPIGLFISMRLMITGHSRILQVVVTSVLAFLTSAIAETGQVLIPIRVASYTDMAFNGVGTIIGLMCAPLIMRLAIFSVNRIKQALSLRPMHALFCIVVTLVVFAKLAPFDFTILPGDFNRSLAQVRWTPFDPPLVPSATLLEDLVELAGSFFAFALLGIFGALSLREAGQSRTASTVNTIARLIFLAMGIELMQLVIRSHACDAADALTYIWGGTLGAILGATVINRHRTGTAAGRVNPAGKLLLSMALVIQAALIVGYAAPGDSQWQLPSLDSVQWIPFYAQFQKPFALGCGQMISSLMWYATLATISAAVMRKRNRRYTFIIVSMLTVGIAILTEAIQACSVIRYADVTEVILAAVAAVTAATAFRWVEHYRSVEPQTVVIETMEADTVG